MTRAKFLDCILAAGIERNLASDDHYTVDGTLVRPLASQESVEPVDGSARKDNDGDARRRDAT